MDTIHPGDSIVAAQSLQMSAGAQKTPAPDCRSVTGRTPPRGPRRPRAVAPLVVAAVRVSAAGALMCGQGLVRAGTVARRVPVPPPVMGPLLGPAWHFDPVTVPWTARGVLPYRAVAGSPSGLGASTELIRHPRPRESARMPMSIR